MPDALVDNVYADPLLNRLATDEQKNQQLIAHIAPMIPETAAELAGGYGLQQLARSIPGGGFHGDTEAALRRIADLEFGKGQTLWTRVPDTDSVAAGAFTYDKGRPQIIYGRGRASPSTILHEMGHAQKRLQLPMGAYAASRALGPIASILAGALMANRHAEGQSGLADLGIAAAGAAPALPMLFEEARATTNAHRLARKYENLLGKIKLRGLKRAYLTYLLSVGIPGGVAYGGVRLREAMSPDLGWRQDLVDLKNRVAGGVKNLMNKFSADREEATRLQFETTYLPAFIKSAADRGLEFQTLEQLGRALQLTAVEITGNPKVAQDEQLLIEALCASPEKRAAYGEPWVGDSVRFVSGPHKGKSGKVVATETEEFRSESEEDDGMVVRKNKRLCSCEVRVDGLGRVWVKDMSQLDHQPKDPVDDAEPKEAAFVQPIEQEVRLPGDRQQQSEQMYRALCAASPERAPGSRNSVRQIQDWGKTAREKQALMPLLKRLSPALKGVKPPKGGLGSDLALVGTGGLLAALLARALQQKSGSDTSHGQQLRQQLEQKLAKRGLWDNIHAKRKRGEPPAKPGDEDRPSDKALKDSQKQGGERSRLVQHYLEKALRQQLEQKPAKAAASRIINGDIGLMQLVETMKRAVAGAKSAKNQVHQK